MTPPDSAQFPDTFVLARGLSQRVPTADGTLDILSEADEVQAIQEGIRAIERGESYSADEVRQAMLDRPAP